MKLYEAIAKRTENLTNGRGLSQYKVAFLAGNLSTKYQSTDKRRNSQRKFVAYMASLLCVRYFVERIFRRPVIQRYRRLNYTTASFLHKNEGIKYKYKKRKATASFQLAVACH